MSQEVDLSELERYLKIYQENPDSRVFAPLADLYRRLGKLDDAEDLCRDGIRRHPYYAGGRVALAHILFNKGELDEAFEEVESVVTYYPDNLLARKILIKVLLGLKQRSRAQKELEALRSMAPEMAEDSEIIKLFNHGTQALTSLNEEHPSKAPIEHSFLHSLEKQKLILGKLIQSL